MAEAFQTARTAALVIDLQKENFTVGAWPVADYRGVLDNAGKVVTACRRAGVPVIYTRHWLDPTGWNAMKHEPVDANGCPLHSVAGHPRAEICDEVAPAAGDIMVEKQRFTGFFNTNLELTLNRLDVEQLIVLGVWTEACLETTVWDALWRDYRVVLVKDACGSATDTMHKTAILDLANWLYGGRIFTADELVKALDGQPFQAWRFETPNAYAYTLETQEALYDSI